MKKKKKREKKLDKEPTVSMRDVRRVAGGCQSSDSAAVFVLPAHQRLYSQKILRKHMEI